MKYLSLFSGAAGGDLGLQHLLGMECVGYVEWDKYCCAVLEQRIKDGLLDDAPILCGDIRRWIELGYAASYTGLVDAVTAGWPCQPHSTAGKREGASDPREGWPAVIETIRQVKPRWFLGENVRGILSTDSGRYFAAILRELAESGYDAQWRVLSAYEMGAPHGRQRLWLVAYAQSQRTRRLPIRQGRPHEAAIDINGNDQKVRHLASTRLSDRQQDQMGQSQAESQLERPTWWATEPRLDRLVHGIPHRVDRIRAAGNGQVPIVAANAWHLLTEGLDT